MSQLILVCVLAAQTTAHRARIQATDGVWIDSRNAKPTQVLKCRQRVNAALTKKLKKRLQDTKR